MPDFVTRDGGNTTSLPSRPIFPLATLADLQAELADTDRALDRLGDGFVVDHDQLLARRERLQWWRRRIVQQINDTETAQ